VLGRRKGYRYFGQSKELLGIKEMFERAAKRRVTGGDNDDEKENCYEFRPLGLGLCLSRHMAWRCGPRLPFVPSGAASSSSLL